MVSMGRGGEGKFSGEEDVTKVNTEVRGRERKSVEEHGRRRKSNENWEMEKRETGQIVRKMETRDRQDKENGGKTKEKWRER